MSRADSGYYGSSTYNEMGRRSQHKNQNLTPPFPLGNQYIYPMPGHYPSDFEYRDNYAPSTISGQDTMPDPSFHSPALPDHQIDPDILGNLGNDGTLAFVGGENDVSGGNLAMNDPATLSENFDLQHISLTNFSHNPDGNHTSPFSVNNMKRHAPHDYTPQPGEKRVRTNTQSGRSSRGPTEHTLSPSQYGSSPGLSSFQDNSQHLRSGLLPSLEAHVSTLQRGFPRSNYPEPPHTVANDPLVYNSDLQFPDPQDVQTSPSKPSPKGKARSKDKKHLCPISGCQKPFSTSNDCDRHLKSVHGRVFKGDLVFVCRVSNCTSSAKAWNRKDNFIQHVVRMHGEDYRNDAESWQVHYDPGVHVLNLNKSKAAKSMPGLASEQLLPDTYSENHSPESHHDELGVAFYQGLQRPKVSQRPGFSPTSGNTARSMSTSMGNNGRTPSTRAPLSVYGQSNVVDPQFLHPPKRYPQNPQQQRQIKYAQTVDTPQGIAARQREMLAKESPPSMTGYPVASKADLQHMGHGFNHGSSQDFSQGIAPEVFVEQTDRRETLTSTPEMSRLHETMDAARQAFEQILTHEQKEKFAHFMSSVKPRSGTSSKSAKSVEKTLNAAADDGKRLRCTADEKCGKLFSKQSELNKHMSRHARRYWCTFDHCYKRFGTKWEWKRHEHNQHIQLEEWRCRLNDGQCGWHFEDQDAFVQHLKDTHAGEYGNLKSEEKECKLAKKWLGSFWCGFCERVVGSRSEYGAAMDEERYNHISQHIDGDKRKMEDWKELKGKGKTKKQAKKKDKKGSLKANLAGKAFDPEKDLVSDPGEDDSDSSGCNDDTTSVPAKNQATNNQHLTGPNTYTPGPSHNRRQSQVPEVIVTQSEDTSTGDVLQESQSIMYSQHGQYDNSFSYDYNHTLPNQRSEPECRYCHRDSCPGCNIQQLDMYETYMPAQRSFTNYHTTVEEEEEDEDEVEFFPLGPH